MAAYFFHFSTNPVPPALAPPQVIFALPPTGDTDLTMRIFNSDGSEPEMCGNGIRCLARFVADVDKATAKKYRIHTLAGAQHAYCAALLHLLHRRLCGGVLQSLKALFVRKILV